MFSPWSPSVLYTDPDTLILFGAPSTFEGIRGRDDLRVTRFV